jgi:cytochrome b involved in lipid metabolism
VRWQQRYYVIIGLATGVVLLISMGEGYHNYHHTFPTDYRNGVRAHHFDPTKWILRTLAVVGLTKRLRRASHAAVLRARRRVAEQRLAREKIPARVRSSGASG